MGKGAEKVFQVPEANVGIKTSSNEKRVSILSASPPPPQLIQPDPIYVNSVPKHAQHLSNAVYLNVYDVLTPDDPTTIPRVNDVLFRCGMGIYHSGVQVWGREFAFGGHPDGDSGIFEVTPRACPSVKYRATIFLGITRLSEKHIDQILEYLGKTEFVGNRYSLISRNCNTFSSHFCVLLGVQDKFPAWVNRLAGFALNVRCILPEGVDEPLSDDLPTPTIKEPRKPPRVAIL